jgi:hypothetical protein
MRMNVWSTNGRLHDYYRALGFKHVRTVDIPGRMSGALFERELARSCPERSAGFGSRGSRRARRGAWGLRPVPALAPQPDERAPWFRASIGQEPTPESPAGPGSIRGRRSATDDDLLLIQRQHPRSVIHHAELQQHVEVSVILAMGLGGLGAP